MGNKSLTPKKKFIIALCIFIGGVVIASAAYLIFIYDAPQKPGDDTSMEVYVDPGSGETVHDNPGKSPETYNERNTIRFLGFSKLVQNGLTDNQQVALRQNYLEYSNQRAEKDKNAAIEEVSVVVDSIRMTINQTSGQKAFTYNTVFNRDYSTIYVSKVSYTGIQDSKLEIFDKDGKQVFSPILRD